MRRKRLQPIITEVFRRHDLLPSWGLAFALCESNFRPWVVNRTGGDGLRGGAWGLFQMTAKTALGLGYNGPDSGLLEPDINAEFAALLIGQLNRRYHNLLDVAAAYNSGKMFALAPDWPTKPYARRVVAEQARYAAMDGVDT